MEFREFSFKRTDRLEAEIQKEAMTILMREVTDPRIGFVTVTRVEMTGDLREVKIYVSVLGDATVKQRAMEGLMSATGYVRYLIGQRVRMRFVPTLEFRLDETLEKSSKVMELFSQIEQEKAAVMKPARKAPRKRAAPRKSAPGTARRGKKR